jgi:hypothetical protein
MNTKQKFKRGDVVHIAADLGPTMSHFTADKDAIVMHSYADKYGGDSHDIYSLMFCDDGSQCSWYHEHQLTFLRHGGEQEIDRVTSEREKREEMQTDLEWIVANWPTIRTRVPGATICELMRRIGISEPWGAHGEGITYYANAQATFKLLDPVLSSGNVEQVKSFFSKIKTHQPKSP